MTFNLIHLLDCEIFQYYATCISWSHFKVLKFSKHIFGTKWKFLAKISSKKKRFKYIPCDISLKVCKTSLQFLYLRFCACKTFFRCMWEIINVKGQMCTLLITTWHQSRNCTKLILKPLAAKNSLSISVLCIASSLYITFNFTWWLPSIHVHYAIYLHSSSTIFDKLKWKAV